MQSSPVSNTQPSTQSSLNAAPQAESADTLNAIDFDNFLQLLTAQLRNQDPLSPLDSADFVAQLASFSSVEQIVGTNQRLDSIAQTLAGGGISEYADWIGREAEVLETPGQFDGATPVRFRLSNDAQATSVEIVITDGVGTEVARLPGQNTTAVQEWDGVVNGVSAQPGIYTVTAVYKDGPDILRTETAATYGVVNEVRLTGSGPVLNLASGLTVDPSKVTGLGSQN